MASSTLNGPGTSALVDAPVASRSISTTTVPATPAPPVEPAAPRIPPSVEAFDSLIDTQLKKFVSLSQSLDDLVGEQVGYTFHSEYVNIDSLLGCFSPKGFFC